MEELWRLCKYKDENEYQRRFNNYIDIITKNYEKLTSIGIYKEYANQSLLRLDDWLLCETIERHFMEVARIKQFHTITDATNPSKVAGFLANWIVRIKPVQILVPLGFENKRIRLINEDLAIAVGLTVFGHFFDPDFTLKKREMENFRYQLRYRVMHADNLAMVFEAYEKPYPEPRVNPKEAESPS